MSFHKNVSAAFLVLCLLTAGSSAGGGNPPLGQGPDKPALAYPPNATAGMPAGVLLNVTLTDPDGGPLNATFYGRMKPENFSIIAIPDTQNYVNSGANAPIFTNQTRWIAQHKAELNIVMAIHVGDMADAWNSDTQYTRANASMSALDGVVPYSVVPGNHDHSGFSTNGSSSYFNSYFPVSRYEGDGWWGGNYSGNDNSYRLLGVEARGFIFLSLDACPSSDEVRWANDTLNSYPDRMMVLATHGFLDVGAVRNVGTCGDTSYIWNDLIRHHPNLRLVLCGHMHGESNRTDSNLGGYPVHQMLADYQSRANGGDGWLRILAFSPKEERIYVKTYSPRLDLYEADSDSEFTLDYDMGVEWAAIGGVPGVESGSYANVTWAGLPENRTYEWYVSVTGNGSGSADSDVWEFSVGGTTTTTTTTTTTLSDCSAGGPPGNGTWEITADDVCQTHDIVVDGGLNISGARFRPSGIRVSLAVPVLKFVDGALELDYATLELF
jgi:3',5'-cyclic AMP phosphodiesterase CpdA